MRRTAIALSLLLPLAAPVAALAASPAQMEAQRQVERDQQEDRVADAARDMRTGGPGTPALVDDMDRDRPTTAPLRSGTRGVTEDTPAGTPVPLLGDNPQR